LGGPGTLFQKGSWPPEAKVGGGFGKYSFTAILILRIAELQSGKLQFSHEYDILNK